MTVGYRESQNFLISENCYLLQFSVSAKVPNVGGLCSAVTGDMRLQISHSHPQFLDASWFLLLMSWKLVTVNISLFVTDIFGLKKKKLPHCLIIFWLNKNMVFLLSFSSTFAKLSHVVCPSWLSSSGDGHGYQAWIYSWVCEFDTEFCQAEKRSVFLQKGGFMIEKLKKPKGSSITIFQ